MEQNAHEGVWKKVSGLHLCMVDLPLGGWVSVPIAQDPGWVPALVWTRYYEFITAGNQKKSNDEKLEQSFEAGKGTPNYLGGGGAKRQIAILVWKRYVSAIAIKPQVPTENVLRCDTVRSSIT